MPAYRNEKVAKELMREISQLVLYEMKDPAVGFVTFTRVEPASDLKSAKVFFSTMGDEKTRGQVLSMLRRARTFIQGNVSRRMRLRHTPELSFHFDESIAGAVRICKLIDEVNRPKEGDGPQAGTPVPDDGEGQGPAAAGEEE